MKSGAFALYWAMLHRGYRMFEFASISRLLAHALHHADYSIRSHMTSHNTAYATARADLFRLAELGLLKRRRMGGKTYAFSVPGDLEERLRSLADELS